MTERFGDAALRHLATAELLNAESRIDDAAYHFGLVGEMALKEAFIRATGMPLPKALWLHINHRKKPLQDAIANDANIVSLLRAGRLGGALGADISYGLLQFRFAGWSLSIRYADDTCCPVRDADVVIWSDDAVVLYNNGVF